MDWTSLFMRCHIWINNCHWLLLAYSFVVSSMNTILACCSIISTCFTLWWLCYSFLVNKLYELNSRTLFALPTAHTVWLVPTAERHRGRILRVQASLQHQVKRVRCSPSFSHFDMYSLEKTPLLTNRFVSLFVVMNSTGIKITFWKGGT